MKSVAWLALSVLAAGCGGPALLIDTTPPILIPNGGSAQAGQVEGPTAIPVTGEGALLAEEEPAAAADSSEPKEALSVIDAAAIEATATPPADDDDDDALPEDDEEEVGEATVAAASAAATPEPAPPAPVAAEPIAAQRSAASPIALASRTRVIGGPGYELTIPGAWETLDPQGLGSLLISSANRSMEPLDGFLTNVIISTEPFPGDAQSYATLNVPTLLEAGCVLRDSQPSRAGDLPAVDVEAFWPNITGVPYITMQRFTTNGSAGYVITCAAAATAFEGERDSCTSILDSFRAD